MKTANGVEIPEAVEKSIRASRSEEGAEKILAELRWDGINKCFYFHFADMYVGVELDGYMHT